MSHVSLDSFRVLHRSSYGHRNFRTLVVVVYDPELPSCQGIEAQVGSRRGCIINP